MIPRKNLVLLLKSVKGEIFPDAYEKSINDSKYTAVSTPVLGFNFINLDELCHCLKTPNHYSSIVFTSQRAVEAIEMAISFHLRKEWSADLKLPWSKKLCFVVGKATGEAAQRIGFCTQGENSGNAENLIQMMLKDIATDPRPVLFPCGNLKRETIPKTLKENNIPLTNITVYETCSDPSIKENLQKVFQNQGLPEYIVFYSPSGVNFTYPIFEELNLPLNSIKLIAIGPTTETALKQKNLTVAGTCEKPTPESLVETLIKTDAPL